MVMVSLKIRFRSTAQHVVVDLVDLVVLAAVVLQDLE
jgi:hypothetical protein